MIKSNMKQLSNEVTLFKSSLYGKKSRVYDITGGLKIGTNYNVQCNYTHKDCEIMRIVVIE